MTAAFRRLKSMMQVPSLVDPRDVARISTPTRRTPSLGLYVRRRVLHWLRATRQLWRANFSVWASPVAGERIRVPILLGQGLVNLAPFEPWLSDTLERFFARRSGAFVDVGVNVGQTLIKAKVLDRLRPYYGFEPSPACCMYLEHLIRLNRFPNCTVVPAGLSDGSRLGTLRFHSNDTLDPRATVVDRFPYDHEGFCSSRVVGLVHGDEVIAELGLGEVAVVKVDVEGGELEVLRGLTETLRRDRPYIICEILPVIDAESPTGRFRLARQQDLLDLVRRLGYTVFRIYENGTTERITEIAAHADVALSNYIFVPEGELDAFRRDFPATSMGV